ncbi:MAG TPA: hypothetical protein VEA63_06070, partial [Opitutus sp.]|nr:hypothetical protein [Opitutus sp.]
IATHALDDDVRGVMFGALVGAASLLLAVMLGVLAIVTTLDGRPIMVRWRKQPRSYERLIDALLGPVFTTLVMAALSIVCVAIPAEGANGDVVAFVVALTLALGVATFFQAAYVGYILSRILLAGENAGTTRSAQTAEPPTTIAPALDPPAPESTVVAAPEPPPVVAPKPSKGRQSKKRGGQQARVAIASGT